ncbi:transglutaminase domain-containing protein [Paenibacillus beijingensis]|uniref:transglutaminase domain-containing protein n=1 Tax=Paenibacillus beijingensis TaxID=1126833 RepID=UPI0006965193|nr:transglutaminase domain-containing protein [Paenibacillus beijingensis]
MKNYFRKMVFPLAVAVLLLFGTAAGGIGGKAYAADINNSTIYKSGGYYTAFSYEEVADIVHGVMANGHGTSVTIQLNSNTSDIGSKLKDVFKQIVMKDDYLRFVEKKISWSWTTTGWSALITYNIEYWETTEQSEYVQQTAKRVVASLVKPRMSDADKVKAIHDWVIDNVTYDETLENHSAYAGLVQPYKTVCQGYALLTYRMLKEAGLESRIVYGDYLGTLHVWNLVKLDGKWVHVDVTLDDTEYDWNRYSYYNLSDAMIALDHRWNRADYPSA